MVSGSVTFATGTIFPLTSSVQMFDRPYLSICRNNQKKKKPDISKLSVLTKASLGSMKAISNQNKRLNLEQKNAKTLSKKTIHRRNDSKQKKKVRSNSCKPRMAKQLRMQSLAMSFEPEYFTKMSKDTPISRTVCKNKIKIASPLDSSVVFESVGHNESPCNRTSHLSDVFDRTFQVLSEYKRQCTDLKRERDWYKNKYFAAYKKLKKLNKSKISSKN